MSWPWIVLLALALVLVVATEWERIAGLVGADSRRMRERRRRKAKLRVVRDDTPADDDVDDFAASVQRDLESLPTIEERDRR
ncbi:MAG TPA: hypothetical protein VNT58_07455 [Gaiellaceae bacterium]|nr:hypothetical protein [Gaiellaceae bacterium]